MNPFVEESRASHLYERACHRSGTYFHGYSDPGWPMKACLLQTLVCALITAQCVSFPAERWVRRRVTEGKSKARGRKRS